MGWGGDVGRRVEENEGMKGYEGRNGLWLELVGDGDDRNA